MPLALDFICPLFNGVHTRPAGALAKTARGFVSEVILTNSRTGQSANSKSVLAVVSAGIRQSDACRLSISGTDEAEAMAVLSSFLSNDLPHCDDARAAAWSGTSATSDAALALFDPRLIVMDADIRTKAGAIDQAVNLLNTSGRTARPAEIVKSIWRREAASSTGFGHGIAIPHCVSTAVLADSLVILKLRTPIDWGSIDDQPVRLIMLMVVRATEDADGRMSILSQLARKLMDENFRERIVQEPDPSALCRFFKASVNLQSGASTSAPSHLQLEPNTGARVG